MSEETEDTRDIEQVTSDLGIAYTVSKSAETELKTEKGVFYQRLDELIASDKLAHKTVDVPISADFMPEQWLAKYHPGWRFANDEKKLGKVVIEEDPSFKKRTYVNHEDGMIYGRTIKVANPELDDERLREEDPELWERITHVESKRVLDDVETISKKDFAKMKKYLVPGKVTVSLMTPREAKPEELDG